DIRRANINVPVLMVTGRNSVPDKVAGLKLGADDYLTKPFHNDELLARLDALLRRFGRAQTVSPSEVYKHAGLFADFKSGEFKLENKPFKLTAHEMKMLHYLVQHQGLIITRDELLTHVWKYGDTVTTRTVDVHVAAIRQKIEKIPSKPKRLISIYGLGYKFIG
ncbi:MAG TPA: response regulator transcription factor, partial [bacterium]|nr:response regulator transcription factor [bacterium]